MQNTIVAPNWEQFDYSLDQRHFAIVPSAVSRESLDFAAEAFLAFLALPETLKQQLHFPAREYRATPDGYTDRSGRDRKDAKQFFHWAPSLKHHRSCTALQANNPVVARFFAAAEHLYRHAEATLETIFTHCLPDYRERIFEGDSLIDGTLRFLSYSPGAAGPFCAQAHYDKGFSTLVLGDSTPGLRIGCCNKHPLFPVRHRDGTAVFMPAWMLFQASGGQIKPAWHDVLHSSGKRNVNRLCARWSIVFFVNDPEGQFSSWDTVHTPLH